MPGCKTELELDSHHFRVGASSAEGQVTSLPTRNGYRGTMILAQQVPTSPVVMSRTSSLWSKDWH